MMLCVAHCRRVGFTLIEVMIVIAIIAILTLIAIPNYSKSKAQSQLKACLQNCQVIGTAMETFLVRHSDADMMWASWNGSGFDTPEDLFKWFGTYNDNNGNLLSYFVENGYLSSVPICTINPPYDDFASYFICYGVHIGGHWSVRCRGPHKGFGGKVKSLSSSAYTSGNNRTPKYILGLGLSENVISY